MDLSPGYGLTPAQTERLALLSFIDADADRRVGVMVPLAPLFDREGADELALINRLRELAGIGLIDLSESLGLGVVAHEVGDTHRDVSEG